MSKKNLIFWFDHPPRVSKGVFNAVSEKWDGDTFYICINDTREERKRLNWDEGGYGKAKLIIMSNIDDSESFISKFISDHQKDIHIFNGYKSKSSSYLKLLIKRNADIVVWAERPNLYGKHKYIKTLFLYLNHCIYAMKYKKKIKAFFVLGEKALSIYKKCGWNNNKLFSFLYLPPVTYKSNFFEKRNMDNVVKFVYVGRLDYSAKGVDLLLDAFEKIDYSNWTLDIIGNYGPDKDSIYHRAIKLKKVSYDLYWPINETCKNLSKYDVCIVPSRYDGWNVTTNEAINAGIGVIISSNAGSDELITFSKAGDIFKTEDLEELIDKIKYVLDNPSIIFDWKNNALNYRNQISPDEVSKYFITVLEHLFIDSTKEVLVPPWKKGK